MITQTFKCLLNEHIFIILKSKSYSNYSLKSHKDNTIIRKEIIKYLRTFEVFSPHRGLLFLIVNHYHSGTYIQGETTLMDLHKDAYLIMVNKQMVNTGKYTMSLNEYQLSKQKGK